MSKKSTSKKASIKAKADTDNFVKAVKVAKLISQPKVKVKKATKIKPKTPLVIPAPVADTPLPLKTQINHSLRELFYVEKILIPKIQGLYGVVCFELNVNGAGAPFYTKNIATYIHEPVSLAIVNILEDFAGEPIFGTMPPTITLGELEMFLHFVILQLRDRVSRLEECLALALVGGPVFIPYPG